MCLLPPHAGLLLSTRSARFSNLSPHPPPLSPEPAPPMYVRGILPPSSPSRPESLATGGRGSQPVLPAHVPDCEQSRPFQACQLCRSLPRCAYIPDLAAIRGKKSNRWSTLHPSPTTYNKWVLLPLTELSPVQTAGMHALMSAIDTSTE